ncbi:hypothetical protein M9H77_12467 [Catharanthus roseus]|uniref:Uncharacterized protein n=1 Tax=Catharanthus roseus TaxID=4058 RepID=A0ACC0BHN6_CATRO|nr:hypothetical protein M9H77_12467 [Catharanthus roseus]
MLRVQTYIWAYHFGLLQGNSTSFCSNLDSSSGNGHSCPSLEYLRLFQRQQKAQEMQIVADFSFILSPAFLVHKFQRGDLQSLIFLTKECLSTYLRVCNPRGSALIIYTSYAQILGSSSVASWINIWVTRDLKAAQTCGDEKWLDKPGIDCCIIFHFSFDELCAGSGNVEAPVIFLKHNLFLVPEAFSYSN